VPSYLIVTQRSMILTWTCVAQSHHRRHGVCSYPPPHWWDEPLHCAWLPLSV